MKTASLDILEKTQLPVDQARAILKVMELENTAWMDGIESRLKRWVFTCMLGQTAVIIGAMYFALNHLRP